MNREAIISRIFIIFMKKDITVRVLEISIMEEIGIDYVNCSRIYIKYEKIM